MGCRAVWPLLVSLAWLALLPPAADGAVLAGDERHRHRRTIHRHISSRAHGRSEKHKSHPRFHVGNRTSAPRAVSELAGRLLQHHKAGKSARGRLHGALKAAAHDIGFEEAARRVQSRGAAPAALVQFLQNSRGSTGASSLRRQLREGEGGFSESAMASAREYLNNIFSKAWSELDDKVMECKEADDRGQETLAQISTDLASVGARISELAQRKSEAIDGISQTKEAIGRAQEELRALETEHAARKSQLLRDVQSQDQNLAVFRELLQVSSCSDDSSDAVFFVQADDSGELCRGGKRAKAKLSLESRQRLGALLALAGPARFPVDKAPPRVSPEDVCAGVPLRCNAVTDIVSEEWGKVRDASDELQALQLRSDDDFTRIKAQLNMQIETLRGAHNVHAAQLSDATSQENQARAEAREKDQERRDLVSSHGAFMAQCRARIEEILFQDMCAVKKIRSAVLRQSTESPPDEIVDCEVSDWAPGQCSATCDSACGSDSAAACGGWQTFTREVVLINSTYGVGCPSLKRQARCGQVPCPVDCVTSEWSGFSECSKECGGGVQDRTRSILTKAKNGGSPCNAVQEARACNTGSCDHDCELAEWTEWSGCSQACGGGYQYKTREVSVPIRGNGRCPTATSHDRVRYQHCNDQACHGDEQCVATQDLVLAVDGSGSISKDDFEVMKSFLGVLVDRHLPKYYGQNKTRLGLVQFGNGELDDDGVVSEAIDVADLTDDLGGLKGEIDGLGHQGGFTNLAQALALAGDKLEDGGREDAEPTVLVVTDGRPATLSVQAADKAQELRDKGVRVYFLEVAEQKGQAFLQMQGWATAPGWAGVEFLPGWSKVQMDESAYAGRAVARFCPEFLSQNATADEANSTGVLLVAQGATCGSAPQRSALLGRDVDDPAACGALAAEAGNTSFYLGREPPVAGHCYAAGAEVDEDTWAAWTAADGLVSPECSSQLSANPMYDFYGIKPGYEFSSIAVAEDYSDE